MQDNKVGYYSTLYPSSSTRSQPSQPGRTTKPGVKYQKKVARNAQEQQESKKVLEAKENNQIWFYRASEFPYGCFSNFSRHSVVMNNKRYPTSEHYFQAMKFFEEELHEKVRTAAQPGHAALIGRDKANPKREDWHDVRNDIMYDVVLAKFTQNLEIQKILLDTGDCKLVEHTSNDSYWGDGGNGTGKNMLGVTLMRVRDTLRNREVHSNAQSSSVQSSQHESNNNNST